MPCVETQLTSGCCSRLLLSRDVRVANNCTTGLSGAMLNSNSIRLSNWAFSYKFFKSKFDCAMKRLTCGIQQQLLLQSGSHSCLRLPLLMLINFPMPVCVKLRVFFLYIHTHTHTVHTHFVCCYMRNDPLPSRKCRLLVRINLAP